MQLEVRVHGNIFRHTGLRARRQVSGNEASQRLLPIQPVFRNGPQLPLQGLPQLPVRHRPRVRQLVIGLVWYFANARLCHSASVWDIDSCLLVQCSELLNYSSCGTWWHTRRNQISSFPETDESIQIGRSVSSVDC